MLARSEVEKRAIGPWAALALMVAAWIAVDAAFEVCCHALLTQFDITDVRQRIAAEALCGSGIMWTMFAACVLILRLRKQTLSDIGWRRPASKRSWVAAFVVALGVSASTLISLGSRAQLLTDWSLYRISLALLMGISAGVCLETVFRGFVMHQARDAGFSTVLQILFSSLLFAVALNRMTWSAYPGTPNLGAVIGTTASSFILGSAFAIIYLIGHRSLTPAITAHLVIDMVVEPGMILFTVMAAVH